MGKKTRTRIAAASTRPGENPRRPCPCGSGKRYKACHGAGDDVIVIRPFEGLAAECELVAMREFLPSATASLPLRGSSPAHGATVTLATILPGASAAVVRPDGEILLGMQVQTRSGDISADLARALVWATQAAPGSVLSVVGPATRGASVDRLQDHLEADAPLEVHVHQDFGWWVTEGTEPTPEVTSILERANAAIMPTEPVIAEGVSCAYWVDTGTMAHLRWVRPEPEEQLLTALARLRAADALDLGEGSRYAGSFRAHGLLVPVWDLDREMHAKEWAEPAGAFARRLAEALDCDDPLTDAERRAREVLAGKQITVR